MSHYIPFDIQEKIIKSLPVRSLIQFRSVSKQWKFFIDSSEFINDYYVCHTGPHHLIISKEIPILLNPRILRSSRGLLGSCCDIDNKERGVLWNPLIRKSVAIDVPSLSFCNTTILHKNVVGFGVCRHTNDPKIVKITSELGTISDRLWNVEAFTLRSGTWKRRPFTRYLDESIYWLAFDGRTNINVIFEWYDLIMSIDMTSDEFTQENIHQSLFTTNLPFIKQSLATQAGAEVDLFISYVRKHLPVRNSNTEAEEVYYIWITGNSVPKSFFVRFTIGKPHGCIKKVYGKWNYGECASLDGSGDQFKQDALFIFKPHSHDINSITIFGKRYSFFACSEQDQLFLLDH